MKKSRIKNDNLALGKNLEWRETDSDLSVTTTLAVPKKAGKKFFNDLDAFFESAIDDLWKEPVEEKVEKNSSSEEIVNTSDKKSGRKSFFSGLDALFSNTVVTGADTQENDGEESTDQEALKRVTFLFKKDKLEALKSMAKKEKLYLRDVISRVLDQYIEEKGISANKN